MAGAVFALGAFGFQRRRARCTLDRQQNVRRTALVLFSTALVTYAVLYLVTTGLAHVGRS